MADIEVSAECIKLITEAHAAAEKIQLSTQNVDFGTIPRPDADVQKIWEKCRVFKPLQLAMAAAGFGNLLSLATLFNPSQNGNNRGGASLLARLIFIADKDHTTWAP